MSAQLTAHFEAIDITYDSNSGDCDFCCCGACPPQCEIYVRLEIWSSASAPSPEVSVFDPPACATTPLEDGVMSIGKTLTAALANGSTHAVFSLAVYDQDADLDLDDLIGTHRTTRSSYTDTTSSNNDILPAAATTSGCDGETTNTGNRAADRYDFHYRVWFTDATPPSPPGTPSHSDPSANSGWDDDTTLDFSWPAASDSHSGISGYEIQLWENGTVVASSIPIGSAPFATVCSSGCDVTYSVEDGSRYRIGVRAVNGGTLDLTPRSKSSYSYSSSVYVDRVNPGTAISSPPAGSWQKEDFAVSFSDSDANLHWCTYQIVTDGSDPESTSWITRTCNSPVTVTVGAAASCSVQGTSSADVCRIYSRVYDEAGRQSPNESRSFGIDYTADPVDGLSAATELEGEPIPPGSWTRDDTPYLHWLEPASISPIAGYSWQIDGEPDCERDLEVTFLDLARNPISDGAHSFRVRAIDGAGNCGEVSSISLDVDTTADTVAGLTASTELGGDPIYDGVTQSDDTPYLEWNASESLAPVTGYSFDVDRTPDCSPDTTGTSTDLGPLGEGTSRFEVRAVDEAGNCGSPSTFDIVVDSCPQLPLTGNFGGLLEEASCSILVGPDFSLDSAGDLTLRFGSEVIFDNGVTIAPDANLAVIFDADLAP